MATWRTMTLGLLLASVLAGALAAGVWWHQRRDRPRAIRYRETGLGRFELAPWEGVLLADDVSFHVESGRAPGGPRRLFGVVRDDEHSLRRPLDEFPLRTQRIEIERVSTGGQLTFEARERIPDDDAFTAAAGEVAPRRKLTPLCPPSWSWEGIRIRGPRELHYQRSLRQQESLAGPRKASTRLFVAGVYMAGQAALRAAASDWAFSRRKSPMLVLRELGTGTELRRASLDRIGGDHRALVEGLSISYATPARVPEVPDDDSRREGAPFVVDIGFYLEPRAEPWELGIHAELGPLRSNELVIRIHP